MARSLAILAEDEDDLHLVMHIAKAAGLPPPQNGLPELLPLAGNDPTKLKTGLAKWNKTAHETLLVVLDGDDDPQATYQRLAAAASQVGISLPSTLPAGGLAHELDDARRVAVWIFPDNVNPGMMEDFVRLLVPADDQLQPCTDAWVRTLQENAAAEPRIEPAARFVPRHAAKARLRVWLAVQSRPGLPPGRALSEGALRLDDRAGPFLDWLRCALAS